MSFNLTHKLPFFFLDFLSTFYNFLPPTSFLLSPTSFLLTHTSFEGLVASWTADTAQGLPNYTSHTVPKVRLHLSESDIWISTYKQICQE